MRRSVALPGGVTSVQLGRQKKPILIANIAGFWDPLLAAFDLMLGLGFLNGRQLGYLVADDVEEILPALTAAAAKVSGAEKVGEVERVERL